MELLQEPGSTCRILLVGNSLANDFITKPQNVERLVFVDEQILQSLSSLKTNNGLLGIFKYPEFPSRPTNELPSFTLYLDQIKDPGNLGTIIRTADWFGIKKIYCSRDCVDPFNSKVIQSSMASILRVEINSIDWEEFHVLASENSIYAATPEGESYFHINKSEVKILCIGNESNGLRNFVLQDAYKKITIPKASNSKTESLNAAVATAILLAWKFSN
ncbi:MAG: RNA methyltransferase [Saprospiraceae bacterium]|nr:RNA methyltransferase [Saprospiraceae bacterium]